jgi:hypothetical protein
MSVRNQSAFSLATNRQISSRTKYVLVEWHWFWEYVNEHRIQIFKTSTDLNFADGHTNGLARELFERIRKLNQGW